LDEPQTMIQKGQKNFYGGTRSQERTWVMCVEPGEEDGNLVILGIPKQKERLVKTKKKIQSAAASLRGEDIYFFSRLPGVRDVTASKGGVTGQRPS